MLQVDPSVTTMHSMLLGSTQLSSTDRFPRRELLQHESSVASRLTGMYPQAGSMSTMASASTGNIMRHLVKGQAPPVAPAHHHTNRPWRGGGGGAGDGAGDAGNEGSASMPRHPAETVHDSMRGGFTHSRISDMALGRGEVVARKDARQLGLLPRLDHAGSGAPPPQDPAPGLGPASSGVAQATYQDLTRAYARESRPPRTPPTAPGHVLATKVGSTGKQWTSKHVPTEPAPVPCRAETAMRATARRPSRASIARDRETGHGAGAGWLAFGHEANLGSSIGVEVGAPMYMEESSRCWGEKPYGTRPVGPEGAPAAVDRATGTRAAAVTFARREATHLDYEARANYKSDKYLLERESNDALVRGRIEQYKTAVDMRRDLERRRQSNYDSGVRYEMAEFGKKGANTPKPMSTLRAPYGVSVDVAA